MSNYPWLDQNLPTLSAPLGWFLDGLARQPKPDDSQPPRNSPRLIWKNNSLQGVDIRLSHTGKRSAVLMVPKADWLTLPVDLPPVRRSEQLRILRLDLAERTPFGLEGSFYDVSVAPNQKHLAHVVPQNAVSEALAAADRDGIDVRWLMRSDTTETPYEQTIDLSTQDRPRFRRLLTFIGCVAVLGLLTLAGPFTSYLSERRLLTDAEADVAALRPQVDAARALDQQIAERLAIQSNNTSGFLFPNRPPVYAILENLTRTIPDHSYLTELSVEGTQINLSGFSAEPEMLVRALNDAPEFQNARFTGTLNNQAEGNRFSIQLSVQEQTP